MVISMILNKEAARLDKEFYAKSYAATNNNTKTYNKSEPGSYYVRQALPGIDPEKQVLGTCGFLNIKVTYLMEGRGESYARVPSKEGDVMRFLEAYFALTEEEFTERWGQFEVVMEKYYILKDILSNYGLDDFHQNNNLIK